MMLNLRYSVPLFVVLALAARAPSQGDVSWNLLTGAGSPGARWYHSMAADPAQGRVVMFGGLVDQVLQGSTWSWDGSSWTQMQPAAAPSARYRSRMAFDPVNAKVLLFGGHNGTGHMVFQDTWLWDGTTWSQASPATSPPARSDHSMAADLVRQRVVLFGGYRVFGPYLGDTWEWDGATWAEVTPGAGPSARTDGVMAYDLARQETVLFGGYRGNGNVLGDTWVWDGVNWTERLPQSRPGARTGTAMAFDPVRNVAVLGGGSNGLVNGYYEDTWEWDGVDWVERTPLRERSPLAYHEVAFDAARGRLLAFGGLRNVLLATTSEYGAYTLAPSFEEYGSGCPGSAGMPGVAPNRRCLPWIGGHWNLFVNGVPQGALTLLAIGLSRAAVPIAGVPGCELLTSGEVGVMLSTFNGSTRFAQHLPGDPALAGVSLRYQAVLLNAGGANSCGLAVSPGGEATIGLW